MFTIHKPSDDPYSGVIRYKGRAAGEYHLDGDDFVVNITKDSAKAAIDEMFGDDEESMKIYFENLADEHLVGQFKDELVKKADGDVCAIDESGAGKIFRGLKDTPENRETVLAMDGIKEVLG